MRYAMRSALFSSVVLVALVAAGCASKTGTGGTVPPSAVSGTAALLSFPSAPHQLSATDETGVVSRASLAADGTFSLVLPKGHTYKLALTTDHGAVPIVFPRQTGRLDASFVLRTDGAHIALGGVHYRPSAPKGGFHVMVSSQGSGQQGSDCSDCVNDDQQTTCDNNGGGDNGGADNSEGEGKSTGSEGESASGNDSSGSGGDNAEQADANAELAVGDQNAPDQVTGCDQQGDNGGNNNVEQTGEH